jgi:GntR family transcriptional regulator
MAPHAFAPIAPGGGDMPLYRAAKRALLDAVSSGRYAPAQALPNETTLAASMGVSIGTLRRAVDELVADHILVRRQGRGTFVATHDGERFVFQFFHVEGRDGTRALPTVELLAFERCRADDEVAEALAMRPGEPLIRVENRLSLQGRPVVFDTLHLPASLFRGLTEKRLRERTGTIYQLYQFDYGITVVRVLERAAAAAADRNAARVLGLGVGLPVLRVRRTALGFGDRPVEYRVSVIHTAQHDYVHALSRPA